MNIETGAKVLERLAKEGQIQAPSLLTTFTLDNPPDFELLYSSFPYTGTLPFSVYLGTPHQGWLNGNLSKEITAWHYRMDGIHTLPEFVVKKHNLTPKDLPVFFNEALRRLQASGTSRILGVTYKSWNNQNVDYSYFAETRETSSGLYYLFQFDDGNPDGWNFKPKRVLRGYEEKFTQSTDQEIVRQAKIISEALSEEISRTDPGYKQTGLVEIEGKVTNGSYGQTGPMAIDVYEGYPHSLNTTLGHADLQNAWLVHAK